MPSLDWIGKSAVLNHHREVPYHLLRCDPKLSVGDPGTGNLLVQGDNLLALKALLPYYAGKVKCIYIDPPYNTGNENWIYNDAVNSPEMRAWLGKAVRRETEDLCRHDKWLCMMYPRLALLREFLSDDGVVFVSIDDNEVHHLRGLMDELFTARNFVTAFVWQKVDSPNDNKVAVTPDHEWILCYAAHKERLALKQMTDASLLDAYRNRDEAGRLFRDRLLKKNGKNSLRSDRPTMFFELTAPDGTKVLPMHDDGRESVWALSPTGIAKADREGRLIWKNRGTSEAPRWIPYTREFAPATPVRPYPSIWLDVMTSRQAKAHQRELLPAETEPFPTPKPEHLIHRILSMCTEPGDLVLDSFAGSGTTGAVAHKMGRRWIMVEVEQHITTHILPRLRKVIDADDAGGISELVGWDEGGGGFQYCALSRPIYGPDGRIDAEVRFGDLAQHVFFSETGLALPRAAPRSPLLGIAKGCAYYLLFNGILGDRTPNGGNVLTSAVLADLPYPPSAKGLPRVIFGEGCRLSAERLRRERVTFKQVPYQIKGR